MKTESDLNKKLGELREDKRELAVKIGQMAITPKSDASYSSAKLDNWQKDLGSLAEKENELEGQLLMIQQGPVEPVVETAPKAKAVPTVKSNGSAPEVKKAAAEIKALADRSNTRAVEITRLIYQLVDELQALQDDLNTATALTRTDPEVLSAWMIQEAFPIGSLLGDMKGIQRRICIFRRDLLEKAGLQPVW